MYYGELSFTFLSSRGRGFPNRAGHNVKVILKSTIMSKNTRRTALIL